VRTGYPLLGCAIVLGSWGLLAYTGVFSPVLLPGPNRVFVRLCEMGLSGELVADTRATLYRWIVGFLLGSGVGIPIGLLMGHFHPVRRTLAIVVDAVRALPVIALMPLFLIFFGVGSKAKIAVAAWAAALAVLLNALYGAGRVKEQWLLTARTLGATPAQIFLKVVVPGSLPEIVVGLRIAISHALVVIIAAEMMLGGGTDGLGRKLTDAAMLFRTTDVYAILCVIGLLGYVSNVAFQFIEQSFFPWLRK
jgi:ABC-type nitrate/sulfonate/bicarbonate transport system permease component